MPVVTATAAFGTRVNSDPEVLTRGHACGASKRSPGQPLWRTSGILKEKPLEMTRRMQMGRKEAGSIGAHMRVPLKNYTATRT